MSLWVLHFDVYNFSNEWVGLKQKLKIVILKNKEPNFPQVL